MQEIFFDDNTNAFLALVRAGLWKKETRLLSLGEFDYNEVLRLAQEQSVIGLVTAGLEYVTDVKVPHVNLLQFLGRSMRIENRNKAMNEFIGVLMERMRKARIPTLLVKGQGIAQCYERPLWRASGDIDLLLSNDDYEKAKAFLLPVASRQKPDERYSKHIGMNIGKWYVEIHGTLRTGLSERVDREVDAVQREVFCGDNVRVWKNGTTQVFLPEINSDVFFVFTHFIKHFYKEGGVSLRQICDWSRLLWIYKDQLNVVLLENRLRNVGLISEWRAFAALAVNYLGMPVEAMPLYDADKKWSNKAEMIISFIMKGGKWERFKDTFTVGKIFPMSTLRFLPGILFNLNWLKIKERLTRNNLMKKE